MHRYHVLRFYCFHGFYSIFLAHHIWGTDCEYGKIDIKLQKIQEDAFSSYIPRGNNVLQQIFKDHFDDFSNQYDEKYASTYGNYNYLPLALRTIKKIETIIREEMMAAGALELLMPAVQPSSLWEESGRWNCYGPELLRFKDRKGTDYCLGPTHDEIITDIV